MKHVVARGPIESDVSAVASAEARTKLEALAKADLSAVTLAKADSVRRSRPPGIGQPFPASTEVFGAALASRDTFYHKRETLPLHFEQNEQIGHFFHQVFDLSNLIKPDDL
jgi:hypothetical protein